MRENLHFVYILRTPTRENIFTPICHHNIFFYRVLGVPVIATDKIVALDEVNKSITFELIDGEVTKYFKSFKATLEAGGVNTVKWSVEYDKVNEDVPHPHSHLQFLGTMAKDIDAYLLKQK